MAVERNVRVKLRLSALESEIGYKGNLDKRGRRELSSQKVVVDAPILEFTDIEYRSRQADLAKVIQRGWSLATEEPCEVWMGDLTVNPVTAVASFNAKVRSNNVATIVTWWIDDKPDWNGAVTQAANESPVQSVDDEMVTGTYDFSLFRGMTFYVQCAVSDGFKTMYSLIKSIEIPALP